jgi:dTDP-4-dehydrorhamnose reductase
MRILVTGASGLLGINLALEAARKYSSAKSHTVFGQVNQRQLRTEAFTVIQADLLEPGEIERVLEETRPDWVIHCAALAILDQCEADPERARKLNTEVPARLASLIAKTNISDRTYPSASSDNVARGGARQKGAAHPAGAAHLIYISTDAVFDGESGNYTEEDDPHPLSIYAKTKLEGEQAVISANPEALIARVNLFGWSINGSRALSEFFFYNLQAGKTVKGFTDVDFCPLLANDLANLLLELLEMNLHGVYHVVSRDCITKYEFALRLARQFGLDESLIVPVSIQDGGLFASRSPHLTLRTEKLSQALGRTPPSIEDGLKKLHELYLQGYPDRLKGMNIH